MSPTFLPVAAPDRRPSPWTGFRTGAAACAAKLLPGKFSAPGGRTGAAAGACLLAALLAGCAAGPGRDGPPRRPPEGLASTPDAEPRIEPLRSGGPNKPYAVLGRSYVPLDADAALRQTGLASWYGQGFHGRPTASGEPYDMYAMTAAHTTMPLPSYARVRNPANGREIVVRINDRGPFHDGRVIDLSYAAALRLDLLRGMAPVEVERIVPAEIRAGTWRRGGAVPGGMAPVVVAAAASSGPGDERMVAVPAAAVRAVATGPADNAAGSTGWTVPLPVRGAPVRVPAPAPALRPASAPAPSDLSARGALSPPGADALLVPTRAAPSGVGTADLPAAQAVPAPDATADDRATRALPQALPPMAPLPLPAPVPVEATAPLSPAPVAPTSRAPAAGPAPSAPTSAAMPTASASASASASGAVSTAGFWLQFGAFGRPEGAEQLRTRLAPALQGVAPRLAVFADGGLHRLQAGPFPSREAAVQAASALQVPDGATPVVVERR